MGQGMNPRPDLVAAHTWAPTSLAVVLPRPPNEAGSVPHPVESNASRWRCIRGGIARALVNSWPRRHARGGAAPPCI